MWLVSVSVFGGGGVLVVLVAVSVIIPWARLLVSCDHNLLFWGVGG